MYRIKDWEHFQHYKHRNPPWIKLHFELLSSEVWVMLDDASRVLAIACMLIASKNDGVVPDNIDYLRRLAYLNSVNFSPLVKCGFLIEIPDASGCKHSSTNADTEVEKSKRRVREEGIQKTTDSMSAIALDKAEKIYAAYPPRTGSQRKKDAIPRIIAILDSGEADIDLLTRAVEIYGADCASLDDRTKVQQCATFFGPEKETWREYVDRAKNQEKESLDEIRKLDPILAEMSDEEMIAEMDRRRSIDESGGDWRKESAGDFDDDTDF